MKLASQYFVPNSIALKADAEIQNGPTVNDVYNQYFLSIIIGKIDLDKGLAELGQKWRQQCGDKILKEVNGIYKKTNK